MDDRPSDDHPNDEPPELTASGGDDAGGGPGPSETGEHDAPAIEVASGRSVEAPNADEAGEQEVPAFVITCPNCQSAIPFVPGVEGFEPSMGRQFMKCDGCDGMGQVKTGSFVAEFAVLPCPDCEARGFKQREGESVPVATSPGVPPWQGAKWSADLNTWV